MYLGKKILAIVPARGGSKEIPMKNLRKWRGMSLVGHVGKFCRKCSFIDAAIISTENDKIGKEAEKHGLKYVFKRPLHLAGDNSPSEKAWKHAWEKYEKKVKTKFDCCLFLEPTSPERKIKEVELALRLLIKKKYDITLTLEKVPIKYSAFKQFSQINKTAKLCSDAGKKFFARQQLPETYIKNGVAYCANRKFLKTNRRINYSKRIGVIITKSKLNIDKMEDLYK